MSSVVSGNLYEVEVNLTDTRWNRQEYMVVANSYEEAIQKVLFVIAGDVADKELVSFDADNSLVINKEVMLGEHLIKNILISGKKLIQ